MCILIVTSLQVVSLTAVLLVCCWLGRGEVVNPFLVSLFCWWLSVLEGVEVVSFANLSGSFHCWGIRMEENFRIAIGISTLVSFTW